MATFKLDGDVITILSEEGPAACPPETAVGSYRLRLRGGGSLLFFDTVDDPCEDRRFGFERLPSWKRVNE